ncbi:hypothetical protein [Amycolatopsis saalfeldensis]|uniref:hypothetical protein n=1 Tax=Amycolatopsis saalfeldensis TaxID=394193 RepID=UPI00116095F9|nr:hypothetical protein [Amycolatopsis saalfeldensis]
MAQVDRAPQVRTFPDNYFRDVNTSVNQQLSEMRRGKINDASGTAFTVVTTSSRRVRTRLRSTTPAVGQGPWQVSRVFRQCSQP